MNIPLPEKRRVKFSSGSLPAPKIACLAACHPFSQQLDVVFPSHPILLEALGNLEARYGNGKAKLSDVVSHAKSFVNKEESDLLILSSSPHEDDVWCIDPRGHLTLSTSKETYERLGLVGQKLAFKDHEDRHVIDVPLWDNTESAAIQAKRKSVLEDWEKRREVELGSGAGLWDVLYCYCSKVKPDQGATPDFIVRPPQGGHIRLIRCERKELQDVHVPVPALATNSPPTSTSSKANSKKVLQTDDAIDEWNHRMEALFEWIGMACLSAQRLFANDRVDPYIGVYEPPTPSRTQNVTHLRWRGLLCPAFVQEVILLSTQFLESSTLQDPSLSSTSFIGITCHALSNSPVSYIPYTMAVNGALNRPGRVPVKLPRHSGEDTWTLILERSLLQPEGSLHWAMVESLGQFDTRWG
ncbi:ribonuclease P 40kDa subunit-domain-containing protein [Crassisporium funariophilum]|nr:ribonuclease P 40kDa subunit-domain-containing protein [Crassisporium funariophilum]